MSDQVLIALLFVGSAIVYVIIGLALRSAARKSASMGTYMGFGSRLYGNTRTADGWIATKWVVFLFMPFVPVKSYEVTSQQKTRVSAMEYRTDYTLREMPGLYWPQLRFLGIVAALFWVSILFGLSIALVEGQRARNAAKPLSGAAPDLTLTFYAGYDGGLGKPQVRLSDLRGQVVLINFCASWSAPCREELPVLETTWQQYRDKGAVVLGIGYMDTDAAALEYLKQSAVTYPYGPGTDETARLYHVQGAPAFVLIDRQGKVVWTQAGPVTESQLAAQLDRALAE